MTGILLVIGFLALLFVIYFLTEKPTPKELNRWDQMEGRTRRSKVVDVKPFEHMGKKELKCNHPGCPYPPEANLFYCRGHEGGFTVLVHSPPKDLGPVPEGVGDAFQPPGPLIIQKSREELVAMYPETSPAYDLFRTEGVSSEPVHESSHSNDDHSHHND